MVPRRTKDNPRLEFLLRGHDPRVGANVPDQIHERDVRPRASGDGIRMDRGWADHHGGPAGLL